MRIKVIPDFQKDPGLYFSFGLLLWTLFIIVFSFDLPEKARLYPLIIGVIGLPLIILIILGRILVGFSFIVNSLGNEKEVLKDEKTKGLLENIPQNEEDSGDAPFAILALWFGGCAVLFILLGYLPAMVLFLFLFSKFFCRYSLTRALAFTAGLAVPLWLMFSVFLSVPPFAGILW